MSRHAAPRLPAVRPATALTGLYIRVALWFALIFIVLNYLGFEAIYQHTTPFYALPMPAFPSPVAFGTSLLLISLLYAAGRLRFGAITRHGRFAWYFWAGAILVATVAAFLIDSSTAGFFHSIAAEWPVVFRNGFAIVVFAAGLWLFDRWLRRVDWFARDPAPIEMRRFLAGAYGFTVLFSIAVALLRGAMDVLGEPYTRVGLEYFHDIGAGGSISGLFAQYERVHEHLSAHSRVHPPGPTAILWVLSYFFGRTPTGVALGTILFGSLAIFPLYAWLRDMLGIRVSVVGVALYTVIPSIVLFTATSADITFMPFTLGTLYLFWRAIHRHSARYAAAAGVGYALMSLISFSLISIGSFFGLVGLLRIYKGEWRVVLKTAAVMLLAFLAVHLALRWSTGFDVVRVFTLSKESFDHDQVLLDRYAPRYPAWTFRFFNPAASSTSRAFQSRCYASGVLRGHSRTPGYSSLSSLLLCWPSTSFTSPAAKANAPPCMSFRFYSPPPPTCSTRSSMTPASRRLFWRPSPSSACNVGSPKSSSIPIGEIRRAVPCALRCVTPIAPMIATCAAASAR